LRLSSKSASHAAVFFSHKKPANSTFSQPDQPKRTGQAKMQYPNISIALTNVRVVLPFKRTSWIAEENNARRGKFNMCKLVVGC
jgi:hypothetical protein